MCHVSVGTIDESQGAGSHDSLWITVTVEKNFKLSLFLEGRAVTLQIAGDVVR